MSSRCALVISLLALTACKDAPPPPKPIPSAAPPPQAPPQEEPRDEPAPSPPPSAAGSSHGDAGASSGEIPSGCALVFGPSELSVTGAPLLWLSPDAPPGEAPRVIFNRGGVAVEGHAAPSPKPVPSGRGSDPSDPPPRAAQPHDPEGASPRPCASAGRFLYCADGGGIVRRTRGFGGEAEIIANVRAGAAIVAASIGGDHAVVASLHDKQTSEGRGSVALVALDKEAPVELSEEGSGASYLALAPHGDKVIALYADTHAAMTPIHARVLSLRDGALDRGQDAVLFLGVGLERITSGVIGAARTGPAFALLALSRDATSFGMAAVAIDEPVPRDDAPVAWSLYPNGLEPAPLAATIGDAVLRVARVRPADADPSSPRELEIGTIGARGAFRKSCTIARGSTFANVSMLADREGTVWIAYTDEAGTWLERRR